MSRMFETLKQSIINRLGPRILLRIGRHNRGRHAIASRYLKGAGIEIGALSQPLIVTGIADVRYVDRVTKAEACARLPHLSPVHLVDPSYIGDGFTLDFLDDGSQDFVIANHVLEHAPDPIGVMKNWTRVLASGGVLFVTVPLAEQCFDRGRSITDLAHLIDDHAAVIEDDLDRLWERSRPHYQEWVDISCVPPGKPAPGPQESQLRVDDLLSRRDEIHFHCFDEQSYRRLVDHFAFNVAPQMRVLEVTRNHTEVIGVLQKSG